MIGRLKGILAAKQPPLLLIDVGGVGYEVEAPMTTIYDLPSVGDEVTLLIHHQVREDAQNLYAFMREAERHLFRELLKISGVGAKLGLAILSGMNAAEFTRCVALGDAATLTALPGIGKKTAERLIMEMRDRLDLEAAELPGAVAGVPDDPAAEATSALVALGYRPPEVAKLIHKVAGLDMSAEDIIRLALKQVAGK